MTHAEQETVIRWDREERTVHLWTADPIEARRWRRYGYTATARDRGWWAIGPAGCIRLRRVVDGQLTRRAGKVAGLRGNAASEA